MSRIILAVALALLAVTAPAYPATEDPYGNGMATLGILALIVQAIAFCAQSFLGCGLEHLRAE